MAGAAGLTALAPVTGDGGPTAPRLAHLSSTVGPSTGAPGPGLARESAPTGPDSGTAADGGLREVRSVPCDPAELVAAINHANAEGGGNLKLAAKCTYLLAGYADGGVEGGNDRSGLPVIYQPINIAGEGATIIRDAKAEEFRFFTVRNGGELKLTDLTLANGRAANGGSISLDHGGTAVVERITVAESAALAPEGGGGGIFNDGHLTVVGSTFVDNSAAGWAGRGGGLLNGGVLTVKGSEFTNNRANGFGGGFANYQGAADISESTLNHNTAGEGGGIASFAARTKVWDTRVTANTARVGGGVANKDATITLRNMTISHNRSEVTGGGISSVQGLLTVDDSTVVDNTTAGDGGGIFAEKSNVLVRYSESSRNTATGPESKGGGVSVVGGQVSLFNSRVTGNGAAREPGGVAAKDVVVKVDDRTVISGNRPCGNGPEQAAACD
ncbi:hypothetical protein OG792_14775 [Micromonospora sp. NBC_01699]|uniref:hypothetical protein n=1 Tax=Micromonospora sp. NBC_01699 TaxID=2975984 RepID=UPI002E32E88E|nr:hypothetical protein [Micromonospora sp. NBC_01699]